MYEECTKASIPTGENGAAVGSTTVTPGCCDGARCRLDRLYTMMMLTSQSRCGGRRSCPRRLRHDRECQRGLTGIVWWCFVTVGAANTPPLLKGISHCHIGGSNPSYTCDDLATLGASWFYTWSATPPQCNASQPAAEWVPQINSLASATHQATTQPVTKPSSRSLASRGRPRHPTNSHEQNIFSHTRTIAYSHHRYDRQRRFSP